MTAGTVDRLNFQGEEPFACVSYDDNDSERAGQILSELALFGFRLWASSGAQGNRDPRDDMIAERIEKCDLFIAFISRNYCDNRDRMDELYYAAVRKRNCVLLRLENIPLPAGVDMLAAGYASFDTFGVSAARTAL